jgi:hypothetical protein
MTAGIVAHLRPKVPTVLIPLMSHDRVLYCGNGARIQSTVGRGA